MKNISGLFLWWPKHICHSGLNSTTFRQERWPTQEKTSKIVSVMCIPYVFGIPSESKHTGRSLFPVPAWGWAGKRGCTFFWKSNARSFDYLPEWGTLRESYPKTCGKIYEKLLHFLPTVAQSSIIIHFPDDLDLKWPLTTIFKIFYSSIDSTNFLEDELLLCWAI